MLCKISTNLTGGNNAPGTVESKPVLCLNFHALSHPFSDALNFLSDLDLLVNHDTIRKIT